MTKAKINSIVGKRNTYQSSEGDNKNQWVKLAEFCSEYFLTRKQVNLLVKKCFLELLSFNGFYYVRLRENINVNQLYF